MTRHTDTILILTGLAMVFGGLFGWRGCRTDAGIIQQYPPVWAVAQANAQTGGWTDPYSPRMVHTFDFPAGVLPNEVGGQYQLGLQVNGGVTLVTNHPAVLSGSSTYISNATVSASAALSTRLCYRFANYTDYSLGFWVYPKTIQATAFDYVSFSDSLDYHALLCYGGAYPRFDFYNNYQHNPQGKCFYSAQNTYTTNAWMHVVFTHNATNLTTAGKVWMNSTNLSVTYFDGGTNVVTLGTIISNWSSPRRGRFTIGARSSDSGENTFFADCANAYFMDFRMWNRILSPSEITNCYLGSPPTNGMDYYFPLTQAVDRTQTYTDKKSNHNLYGHSGNLGYEPYWSADIVTTGAIKCIEAPTALKYYSLVASNIVAGSLSTGFLFSTWVSHKGLYAANLGYLVSFRSGGTSQLHLALGCNDYVLGQLPSNSINILDVTASRCGYAASNVWNSSYHTNWHHISWYYTPTISNNMQVWIDSTNFPISLTPSNNLVNVQEIALLNRSANESCSLNAAIYGTRLYYPPPSGDINAIVSNIYANAVSPYNPTNEVFP